MAREGFKEIFVAPKTHTSHFSTFPNSFSTPHVTPMGHLIGKKERNTILAVPLGLPGTIDSLIASYE